ncbi:MAG: hypothetical protein IJT60_06825 [Clostridia bacterium]|nr:hypothetical protein [Clostridia bacterium]
MANEELNELNKQPLTQEKNDRFEDFEEGVHSEKSFVARLSMSEEDVREYYSAITAKLLSYDKVRARVGWSGATFMAGRAQMARITIRGKTLCLFLAIDPEEQQSGRYKAQDFSDTTKYAKTPSLLRIRSHGARDFAIAQIDSLAASMGLTVNDKNEAGIPIVTFPKDNYKNLVARGLIREAKPIETSKFDKLYPRREMPENMDFVSENAYEDTVVSGEKLISHYGIYAEIADALAGGNATVKLSKKLMLRSIDEIWINTIEDCLVALDELIRNPSRFIEETEEVLPIELTKKITSRSVQHLSQHTDYISKVEGDTVTPSKILNVFRDDSMMTYENKFLNTIINRLYYFVHKRYEIGKKQGVDESVTEMSFEDTFLHGEMRGNVKISVQLSEKVYEKPDVKNTTYSQGLWARVEKLDKITASYLQSDFAKHMGRAFIKPPVMRTNAIRKNKYFRQCLALWEFIESYDDSGYGLVIDEKLEDLSLDYIRQIYTGAATQYLLFRHNVRGDYDVEKELASSVTPEFSPQIVSEIQKPDKKDFDIVVKDIDEAEEQDILFALEVALRANTIFMKEHPEKSAMAAEALSAAFAKGYTDRSFMAKLILSSNELKHFYVELCKTFASFKGVRSRVSWQHTTFTKGRQTIAIAGIKGKTLYLYLAIDPDNQLEKYYIQNVSDVKTYEKVPAQFKIRSERGLKFARELIDILKEKFELVETDTPAEVQTEYPSETFQALKARGLIRVRGGQQEPQFESEETVFQPIQMPEPQPEPVKPELKPLEEKPHFEPAEEEEEIVETEEGELPESDEEDYDGDEAFEEEEKPSTVTKADIPFSYSAAGPQAPKLSEEKFPEADRTHAGGIDHVMAEPIAENPYGGERTDKRDAGQDIQIAETADSEKIANEELKESTIAQAEADKAEPHDEDDVMDLSKIHRPQNMDYSRPTNAGIDDVTGFISDIESEEPESGHKKKEKKGLFSKLFNSNKNKK